MRGRVIILVGAIVLLAIVAAVFLMTGGNGDSTEGETGETSAGGDVEPVATNIPTVQIVVAAQSMDRGMVIPEDGVFVQDWPVTALPEDGEYFKANQLIDVVGRIVRTDIPRGAPILARHVVDNLAETARTGSDAAAVMTALDPGTVAISIPLDPSGIGQVAYGIQDGDYVDVILSFLFVDVDPFFQTRMPNNVSIITRLETGELSIGAPRQGRPETGGALSSEGVLLGPSEASQRPRLVTQRTVRNAWVVHVGYFPPGGSLVGPTPSKIPENTPVPSEGEGQQQQQAGPVPTATPFAPLIMTLAVNQQDALVLAWAIDSQIPITLVLRRAQDNTVQDVASVSLDYMVNTYQVQLPNALEYALEPPITSVRRFDIATLFNFLGSSLAQ